MTVSTMQASIILTAATAVLALDSIGSTDASECEADHQCIGGYCYIETGKCVTCIDCASYMRKPSPKHACGREPGDCGECFPGFEDEYIFKGITRNFCIRKKEKKKEKTNDSINEETWYILIVGFSFIVITCAVFAVHKFLEVRKRRSGECTSNPDAEDPIHSENQNSNSPPTYESCIPLLQQSGVSSAVATSFTVVEKPDGSLQQAVPFSNPHPPYGSDQPEDLEDEIQEVNLEDIAQPHSPLFPSDDEHEALRPISPPQFLDEDTLPSDWTANGESSLVHEGASFDGDNLAAVSLPSIHNVNVAGASSHSEEIMNDSGVSASCSQSEVSCIHEVEGLEDLASGHGLEDLGSGHGNGIYSFMQRHRSDEDLSSLTEIQERKRQRRDSGSSSMTFAEPFQSNM